MILGMGSIDFFATNSRIDLVLIRIAVGFNQRTKNNKLRALPNCLEYLAKAQEIDFYNPLVKTNG